MNHHPAPLRDQGAAPALTARQEKRRLAAALGGLKDAQRIDLVMAVMLYETNGLEHALAFVERLDRYRRWEPPPFLEGALLLPDAPPHPRTRESVLAWMAEHLPETDHCLIWPEWQERKDSHPVIYLRGLPFVAYWVAYEARNGAVPQGLDVEQACGEYRCVNPKHLTLAPAARSGSDSEPDRGTRS
jgi:hypothetical protein